MLRRIRKVYPYTDELQKLQDQQRKQSPQQDTVRRWLAPRAHDDDLRGMGQRRGGVGGILR